MKRTSLLLLAVLFTLVAFAAPEDVKVITEVQTKLCECVRQTGVKIRRKDRTDQTPQH